MEVSIYAVRSCRSDRTALFCADYACVMPCSSIALRLIVLYVVGAVFVSDAIGEAMFEFDPRIVDADLVLEDAPTTASAATPTVTPKFGAEGSMRWQLLGGYMNDLEGDSQAEFGASLSWFFVENLSMDFQIEGDYIAQSGGDAWGGGGTFLLRWHFINTDAWSLYGDLGCGIIGTSVPVPSGGSAVNFTPQCGGGVSFAISPDVRLMLGARWYHISNANTGEGNPGRNSVMGYVMLSFPF